MNILLMYVPISDPTSGYHSLSYLKSYAEKLDDCHIGIIDTNIEAFFYTVENEFDSIIEKNTNLFDALLNKDALTSLEQLQLYVLWKSNIKNKNEILDAIAVLKDENAFFDYTRYLSAVEKINNWLQILSVAAFPGQFKSFTLNPSYGYNLNHLDDLTSEIVIDRITRPFHGYFHHVLLPKIQKTDYDVIGMNITYTFQLPFALYIGRLIHKVFPHIRIIYGGTEVTDIYKCINEKDHFFDIFDVAYACVIGEGETAFAKLIETIRKHSLTSIPNVVINQKICTQGNKDNYTLNSFKAEAENIENIPAPDYHELPWNRYLSPYKFIYYSPSRGCYWSRCAFCDYGLNFKKATSRWRQCSTDKIVCDLKHWVGDYKYIYFSVDALSPVLLIDLAKRIIEEKLDIRWGCELRLDKNWTLDECKALKKSGCIAVSVGFESANQRVLDLMCKGTKITKTTQILKNLSDAGIAVQIMSFTDFPTETFNEAMETINYLKKYRDFWTFGGIGSFILLSGSKVAKDPEFYHVKNLSNFKNNDINREMNYAEFSPKSGDEKATLKKERENLNLTLLSRPWLGGTDTPHTFMYIDRCGKDFYKDIYLNHFDMDTEFILNGIIKENLCGYNVQDLLTPAKLQNLIKSLHKKGTNITYRLFTEYSRSNCMKKSNLQNKKRFYIRTDGNVYPFPEQMIAFLSEFTHSASLRQILNNAQTEDEKNLAEQLANHSIKNHFIYPVTGQNLNNLSRKSKISIWNHPEDF